jgi:hypothetical protein
MGAGYVPYHSEKADSFVQRCQVTKVSGFLEDAVHVFRRHTQQHRVF